MIYNLLMIGHILGDFYFQSDKMTAEKGCHWKTLLKHCIYYAMAILLCSMIVISRREILKYVLFLLGIICVHGLIDIVRIKIDFQYLILSFLLDQLLHIIVLVVGVSSLDFSDTSYVVMLGKTFEIHTWNNIVNMIIGILICAKPASILIKMIFSVMAGYEKKMIDVNQETSTKVADNPRAGELIGILEREVIFILGISGQFAVIGFVMAAKSLARYKQLEDQRFAERYLVGTLLSALIAIICVSIYQ